MYYIITVCFKFIVGLFFYVLDLVLQLKSRFGVLEKPLHTQQKGTNEKNKLKREKKKRKQKTVLFSYLLQRLTDKLSDKVMELQQKHGEREREGTCYSCCCFVLKQLYMFEREFRYGIIIKNPTENS